MTNDEGPNDEDTQGGPTLPLRHSGFVIPPSHSILNLTHALAALTIHPMYILTRYVVWEVLKVFVAALVGLTMMVTLGMGFNEGMKQGLPALVMLRTMPYMMPEMLGITIPVAMLYAVSNVFGRMTGTNEIVAIKSLGINPMVTVWPIVVLAGFLSLGTVWMYEIAATWCRPGVTRTVCESIEPIVYGMLQKNRSVDGDNFPFSITVKGLDGRKMIQPTIILKGQSGRPQTIISCEWAELSTDHDRTNPKKLAMRLRCFNSHVDIDGKSLFWPGKYDCSMPIVVPSPDRHHRDWVAMWYIPTSIAELQREINNYKSQLARALQLKASFDKANKLLGLVESNQIAQLQGQIADRQNRIFRLRTEPYRRWSNGFTCLCFTLIGIPVAMLWRHADALTNFFVCFLPILALYYPLMMLSENLSTSGTLPPISFWMSNVALGVPAVILLRQINKH
jgi:lipopolysaccharide export system permease protein